MSTHLPIRRLLAAGLLAGAVAAAATGCGDETSGTAQSAESAPVAELSASSSPAEKLEAAVTRTLNAGPIRVSTVADGVTTESQLDYSQRVTYTEMGDASSPVQGVLMRDDVVFVLPGQGAEGAKPGTWYRIADSNGMSGMLGKTFDSEFVKKLVLSSKEIVESGREDVDGTSTTHFVVTPDPDVMIDLAMEALPEEMKTSGVDLRAAMRPQVPTALHYWVGDDGYLVKEDDGAQVKTYHSFGEPLDLPEFDEDTVEVLPGA
ncbi:hypothetical protein [Rhodococcus triatomae]